MINLQDEKHFLVSSPSLDMMDESIPPFYVTLKVHEFLLYNFMIDSGASHNLMPKVIMGQLWLQIIRPYHVLRTFNSNKVSFLVLINDLVVTPTQILVKSIVMDIVVIDIPPKFGMLLSRSHCSKLGESDPNLKKNVKNYIYNCKYKDVVE